MFRLFLAGEWPVSCRAAQVLLLAACQRLRPGASEALLVGFRLDHRISHGGCAFGLWSLAFGVWRGASEFATGDSSPGKA